MKTNFNIRIKIFILICTFFSIFVMGFISYTLNQSKKDFLSYWENLNNTSSSLIIKNVSGDLYNLNYTKVKRTINSFSNKFFKDIYILDTDGKIFASKESNNLSFSLYSNFDSLKKLKYNKEEYYFSHIYFAKKHIGYLLIEFDSELLKQLEKDRKKEIYFILLIAFIIIVFISYIISTLITNPINKLVQKLITLKEKESLNFKYTNNDEFGYLAKIIEQKHKQVYQLNNTLENRVKEEVLKNREKDIMLEKQSLRASLGEMMDSVAHQWKQPLNLIANKSQELVIVSMIEEITQKDIERCSDEINEQINHMVNTLDEFRSFFRDNKKHETVALKSVVENTLALLKSDIIKNNLNIKVEQNDSVKATLIPNEFKHVMINLITNTQDAFLINNIKTRDIKINFSEDENFSYLIYQDSAGGISSDIIEHIFKANFTTKSEFKGTGVGLYMTKMIIEKINGKIDVQNKNNGVCFKLSFPK